MSTTSISIMRGWIKIEIWAISISSMRGWIIILGFWLHVCLILTSCCSLNNGLTSITMRNVGHFNFKHERMTENRNVDYFNFKHERLNKKFFDYTLRLSYLDFFLFFKQWINIGNVDHFNNKHERLNKNYLILALCLSYLDFLSFFKQ